MFVDKWMHTSTRYLFPCSMAVLGSFRPCFFLFGESTLPPARANLRFGGHRTNLANVEEKKFCSPYVYSVTSVQNRGRTNRFSYFQRQVRIHEAHGVFFRMMRGSRLMTVQSLEWNSCCFTVTVEQILWCGRSQFHSITCHEGIEGDYRYGCTLTLT